MGIPARLCPARHGHSDISDGRGGLRTDVVCAPRHTGGKGEEEESSWCVAVGALIDNALTCALVLGPQTDKVLVDKDLPLIAAILAAREAAGKLFAKCSFDQAELRARYRAHKRGAHV